MLTGIAYQSQVRDSLRLVGKTCAYCFVNGDPFTVAGHTFGACPRLPNKSDFYAWRKCIRYGHGVAVCYRCHVPQGDNEALHPRFSTDASQCEFRDVVAPLVFSLLGRSEMRADLQSAFPGLDATTPASALVWINSAATDGHLTNLVALFVWYCRQFV